MDDKKKKAELELLKKKEEKEKQDKLDLENMKNDVFVEKENHREKTPILCSRGDIGNNYRIYSVDGDFLANLGTCYSANWEESSS